MNDDADDSDPLLPWELLEPLVIYMVTKGIREIRLESRQLPDRPAVEPQRETSEHEISCDAAPDAPGLQGTYAVSDESGGGLIGPTSVPQSLIRPILRALDATPVTGISIKTDAPIFSEPATTTTLAPPAESFEEFELPSSDNWPPAVVAVQCPRGGADG
ncbi:hypothetical protein [Microbacterium sp. SLBN-111]|uniref:hypothetical protein n=1 Tax=Microbacterium sp. SLBN-111 TaxID=3377733 RepID=UPI003C73A698